MSIDLSNNLSLAQRPRLREACIKLQELAETLGPSAKLPTMIELRDQLGMSLHTLNNAIRELERRQVIYSVNGVGIYVADSKPRAQTGTLGFMTNNIRHVQNLPYYDLIMEGMRTEAEKRDRHILIIDNVERFYQWEKIDGVLFIDKYEKSLPCPTLPSAPKGVPSLAVLNPIPGTIGVTADDSEALRILTSYLIELGHTRIAYIAALNEGIENLQRRCDGYLLALQEAGIERDDRLVRDLYTGNLHLDGDGFEEIGRRHIENWLSEVEAWEETGCTAIIAQNDATAVGMITALQEGGFNVPKDISVVGFDGISSTQPPLTTMEVPLFDMGQTAVQMLCDWIENPSQIPQDTALAGHLIVGDTSQPPRTSNQLHEVAQLNAS